jgi:uncharacterized protein (TIGR04255 family)
MRIETSERVVYEHNPLAEVVCQVQFAKLDDLSEAEKPVLKGELARTGYPAFGEEVSFGFSQQIVVNGAAAPIATPIAFPQVRVSHFTSEDGVWRVSISNEFLALTCLRYSGWDKFFPRMLEAARAFVAARPKAQPTRLGLRYKDVIERESVGLTGTPWHELIKPFLLGPLAPDALAEGQSPSEAEVGNFLSQALLRLGHSMLLLQSSILTSTDGQRRAFMIDADFYNEGHLEPELLEKPEFLSARLDALHASAGALFRRGITEKLHHALRPSN